MIVVKVELHSAIDGTVEEIGRMYVCNTGGTSDRGNYTAAVCRRNTSQLPQPLAPNLNAPQPTRHGKVSNYPRNSYNMWRLISRALKACFPEELIVKPTETRPCLDADVMRGLQELADTILPGVSPGSAEMKRALDWIRSGAADHSST